MELTDRNHFHAVMQAARRRSVIRYEHVGKKIVKVVYSLVHSNNEKELMKARMRRKELNKVVEGKPGRLKIVTD